MDRDRGLCQHSGANLAGPVPSSCHHRVLKSQGGPDTPENRVMLSGSGTTGSHGWAHTQDRAEAERLGYIVRSWKDPADVPIWSEPRQEWLYLTSGYEALTEDEYLERRASGQAAELQHDHPGQADRW
jgi:hypothetical protein